jgi:hypothetical protein
MTLGSLRTDRDDSLLGALTKGGIGCAFAAAAVQRGEVAVADVDGTDIAPDDLAEILLEHVRTFFRHEHLRTLLLRPTPAPTCVEEGQALARRWHEVLDAVLLLVSEERYKQAKLIQPVFAAAEEAQAGEMNEAYTTWMQHPGAVSERQMEVAYTILERRKGALPWPTRPEASTDTRTFCNEEVAPSSLWVPTLQMDMDTLFLFSQAPYYTPLQPSYAHPRWAPEWFLAVNYRRDLHASYKQSPKIIEHIRRWMFDAVGYLYKQGLHVDQVPWPRQTA